MVCFQYHERFKLLQIAEPVGRGCGHWNRTLSILTNYIVYSRLPSPNQSQPVQMPDRRSRSPPSDATILTLAKLIFGVGWRGTSGTWLGNRRFLWIYRRVKRSLRIHQLKECWAVLFRSNGNDVPSFLPSKGWFKPSSE